MAEEKWTQVKEIFDAVLRQKPEKRSEFLDEACNGDNSVRLEVESLLSSFGRADGFMEKPAIDGGTAGETVEIDALTAGQVLGHYEIIRQIGAGGMGEVYLARDASLDRKVAVKVLSGEMATGNHLERFIREAQAASSLNNPHICTVYEINRDHEPPYIAMEFIEGETLDDRIGKGKLDPSDALDIALQISDGLAEAHQAGIVHRDIKPANIIINKRGRVKIVDFGLAKRVTSAADDRTQQQLSVSGMILGTVSYMSPEQARGESVDARTDIWSLGVLLYEMVSGQRPFSGGSVAENIAAILISEPAQLDDLSPGFAALIRKCLEKDRVRRYQEMRDVAADLERIRFECESGATSAPKEEVIGRSKSKPRAGLISLKSALAFASLALFAAVAIYSFSLWSQSPRKADNRADLSPAYDLYLRGKVNTASENPENNDSAIEVLEQAIAVDPKFAPAYAELARAYSVKAFYYGADENLRKKLNEDAEFALQKALSLDPDLAEAHFARGLILWTHRNRFPHEQAIKAYKRALALDQNLDEAHHQLGLVYFHIGLLDKGWEEIEKAVTINPGNTLARFRFGVINMYRGRYGEALAYFKSTSLDKNPSIWSFQTANALLQLGREQEADVIVNDYLSKYSTDEGGTVTGLKAVLLAKAGRQREAEETIERAVQIGRGFGHFHHTAYNVASAYALLNKPEQAIKWLRTAAEDGFPCYPLFENDANLDSLRRDPEFVRFMAEMKSLNEKYKSEFR